jgi:putative adenylate-forming enzyme
VNDTLAIVLQYLRVRHGRPFQSRVDLERYQHQAFDHLARTHLTRSPFYQPYVGRELADYPQIDRSIMIRHFDQINTRRLERDRLVALALQAEATRDFAPTFGEMAVGLSSGTSGQRSLFVTSRRERQLYIGGVLARALPGTLFERQRIALLLRANNRLYAAAATGRIAFAFFDLLLPFESIEQGLHAYQPDVLIGPPQALRLLVDAQCARRVRLSPRKVISCAEVLEAADALAIEQAMGVRVDQIYQATEGWLGITCARGTLHLNEDVLVVERDWLDRAERCFVPIITDVLRSTQPIVRYRLDDVLVERVEPCPCGSILTGIDRIRGRADDILFLPGLGSDTLAPVMPDFIRDALAAHHDVLADYRVVQLSPNRIALRADGPDSAAAWSTATRTLAAVFARHGVQQPAIEQGEPIYRHPAQKRRRVERRFAIVPPPG